MSKKQKRFGNSKVISTTHDNDGVTITEGKKQEGLFIEEKIVILILIRKNLAEMIFYKSMSLTD